MIIGIDASRANEQEKTGTEWYAFSVIQELKSIIPTTVHVVLYVREESATAGGPLLTVLPKNWRVAVLRWPPRILWTQLRLSLEQLLHPPDILYIPAHTIPILHPKRVVAVLHDVGFLHNAANYNQQIGRIRSSLVQWSLNLAVWLATCGRFRATEADYHRFAAAFAVKHASVLMTISAFSQREIACNFHISPQRIIVAPNGFSPFPCQKKNHTLFMAQSIDRPYFLTVGRIEEKKNIPRLVESFARFCKLSPEHNFQLVLAGKPGVGYERVLRLVRQYQLEQDILVTGWVDEEKLQQLYCHAAAFVMPSLYEGFGIPIVEAMHAGLPIVASDIPALREVGDAVPLFCDPTSVASLSDALARVVTMPPSERASRITKGKARATQFSWRATAQNTWEQIEKLGSTLQ